MRLARVLLLPLFVVMVLVGAWHHWGHRVLPVLLARVGLHDVRLGQVTLTTDSLGIGQFTATLVLGAGPVRIDLSDVLCGYRFYNQDVSPGALLIEIGGHANTVQQAVRAGQYAAKALAALFDGSV